MAIPQVRNEEKQLNLKVITWGDLTWVDIVPPKKAEIEYLAENYKFHLERTSYRIRRRVPATMILSSGAAVWFRKWVSSRVEVCQ